MTEEEIKAIEYVKAQRGIYYKTCINIIEKQQKEIENSVSKDAIKEQIKWLEHDIEKTKQNITEGNNIGTYINDYRKIRMKAFVTKSKEIKSRLEKLLGE